MIDKILGKYKNIILIVGIIGIALIFLSSFFTSDNNKIKSESSSTATTTSSTINTDDYINEMESNLTDMISSIKGVGNVKVMVTLENGTETEYATEKKIDNQTNSSQTTDKTETTYITIKDQNGAEEAIPITEYAPTVRGVVVVCDGGDQPVVQERVTDTVTTALNIPSSHVCVTK